MSRTYRIPLDVIYHPERGAYYQAVEQALSAFERGEALVMPVQPAPPANPAPIVPRTQPGAYLEKMAAHWQRRMEEAAQ